MADINDTPLPFGPQMPEQLDFDDRRRMALENVLMIVEQQGGIYPMQFGQIILENVLSEDEIHPMNKAVNKSLAQRIKAAGGF
jgi:hypothetical protein